MRDLHRSLGVFNRLAIAKKIAIIPVTLLLLSATTGAIVYFTANDLKHNIDHITDHAMPVSALAADLISNTLSTQAAIKQYYHTHSRDDLALIDLKIEEQKWLLAELSLQELSASQVTMLSQLTDYFPEYAKLINRQLPYIVSEQDAIVDHFNHQLGPQMSALLTNLRNHSIDDAAVVLQVAPVQLHLSKLRYFFNIYATSGASQDIERVELELMALKEELLLLSDILNTEQHAEHSLTWVARFSDLITQAQKQVVEIRHVSSKNSRLIYHTIPQARQKVENHVLRLQVSANAGTREAGEMSHQGIDDMIWRSGVINLVSIGLGVLISLVVIRRITSPVSHLSETMLEIASSGQLNTRVKGLPNDEIGQAGAALNQMLSQQQKAIAEVSKVVQQVAVGNFDARMTMDANGDFLTLKKALNRSCENIDHSMLVIADVMKSLQQGDFKQQVSLDGLEGAFYRSAQRANSTLAELDAVMSDISAVMEQSTKGDFSGRVSVTASGDLHLLKQRINASMDSLENTVQEIMTVANGMSEGVLSKRIHGEYQGQLQLITQGLNTTLSNLKSTVSDVQNMATKVKFGSAHISDESKKLDGRINTQMEALTEISVSMKEVFAAARLNAKGSSEANQVMQQSLKGSEDSREIVDLAVQSMQQIKSSSSEISEIISVIDSISFQTNILALNAAVEAARAGEHGRGFSVVAHEIRALSQRTSKASKDIEALIKDSSVKVIEGSDLVLQAGEALESIYQALQESGAMVEEITVASNQQIDSMQDISTAVTQLEALSEQNKHLVQSASIAGSSLDKEAQSLTELMGYFETGEEKVVQLG